MVYIMKYVLKLVSNAALCFIFNSKRDRTVSYSAKINTGTKLDKHTKIYKKVSIVNSHIGVGTYIGPNSSLNNTHVGRYCSIANDVKVIIGRHPTSEFVSSHPSFYSTKKQAGFSFVELNKFQEHKYASFDKKISVIIGSDVWIGANVIIMEGVTIGNGAIIAAGSVVTKDIEPYAIYMGIPAKKYKMRFSDNVVHLLLESEWWMKDFNWIKSHASLFNDENKLIKVLLDA